LSFFPHRYRKVVSNNCTDGVRERYTAKSQKCPGKAPRGLRIVTADGKLTAEQGHNVTLMVQLEEVRMTLSYICFLAQVISSNKSWFCLHIFFNFLNFRSNYFCYFILLLVQCFLLLFHLPWDISSITFILLQVVPLFYFLTPQGFSLDLALLCWHV
jgi:magnesium-transporting ATPase (P-type)